MNDVERMGVILGALESEKAALRADLERVTRRAEFAEHNLADERQGAEGLRLARETLRLKLAASEAAGDEVRADRDRLSGEVEQLTRQLREDHERFLHDRARRKDVVQAIEAQRDELRDIVKAAASTPGYVAALYRMQQERDTARGEVAAERTCCDEERRSKRAAREELHVEIKAHVAHHERENADNARLRGEVAALTAERDALLARLPPAEVCRVHGEVCVHGRRVGTPCLHCGGRASK